MSGPIARALPRHLDTWAIVLVPFTVGVLRSLGDRDQVLMAAAWLLSCLAYGLWRVVLAPGPPALSGRGTQAPDTAPAARSVPQERGKTASGLTEPAIAPRCATRLVSVLAAAALAWCLVMRPDLAIWVPAPLLLGALALWLTRRPGGDEAGSSASSASAASSATAASMSSMSSVASMAFMAVVAPALTAVAAGIVGLAAYQGGYPDGGTIEVGWRAVIAVEVIVVAACISFAAARVASTHRPTLPPLLVAVAWPLAWAVACVAVSQWTAHPPGLRGKALALAALLFAGLAARAVVVARTRLPSLLVALADVCIWVGFLTLVWRWN